MAKVKKPMKRAMKKSAPKMMPAPPMQAPPTGGMPMGGGPMMKKGGKVKKYQNAPGPITKTLPGVTVNSNTPNRGGKKVQTSPGGAYKTKTTYDASGTPIKVVERRTAKGLISGAPKARGVISQTFKRGGKMSKKK